MPVPNVLVTSLSRKVPLLEALRAAQREQGGGGVLWGGDVDPECVGRWFADDFWPMPRLSEPDATDAVLEFCAHQEIALVVPTRDGELEFFAELRDSFEAGGTYVAVGTREAVTSCLDKLALHDHCVGTGVPVAATSTDLEALGGDSFVVKERRGAASRSVGVGLDRVSARIYAQQLEEPIFQPTLEGIEHSVDVYVNRAGRVVDAAPRTRIRVHNGESTVTETVEHPGLVDASVRLAESLDLRGHLVIQGFALGDKATLIECNPRVGGASTLGFAAGVDSPAWALAEALGERVEPRRGAYRRGLAMVRYPADRLVER
jgi:carbamoyl-phosphate synthase large subunit